MFDPKADQVLEGFRRCYPGRMHPGSPEYQRMRAEIVDAFDFLAIKCCEEYFDAEY